MVHNMTEGKPIRLILSFSVMVLLGDLFQQFYNIMDAVIVGRTLGPEALAAVGATSSVQFLILGFGMGLCMGFGIPVSQRFGAQDFTNMRRYIRHGWVLIGVMALACTVICTLLTGNIIRLLAVSDNIFSMTYSYLVIIFMGIPCTLLYNYVANILRALGDSRTPFLFLVLSATLNIGLDLLFIQVFQWGCGGAAFATILSQGVSGVLSFLYMRQHYEVLKIRPEERGWSFGIAGKLMGMGVPMGLQFSITAIGMMVMQASINGLGSVYSSAFTAGSRLKVFMMTPFNALGSGASTFVGQNYGANKPARIRKGVFQTLICGLSYGVLSGVVMILFGRQLTMIFLSGGAGVDEILEHSAYYLRCLGYLWWLLAILNIYRMSTQGLGYSNRAVYAGVLEMIARSAVCLIFVPHYGYDAIVWADQMAWVLACLYIVPTFLYCMKKVEGKIGRQKPGKQESDWQESVKDDSGRQESGRQKSGRRESGSESLSTIKSRHRFHSTKAEG